MNVYISVISYSFLCFPELRVQIISPFWYGSYSAPVIILAAFLCTSSSSVTALEMEGPRQRGAKTAQSIQETRIGFTYSHNVVSLLFNSFLLLKFGSFALLLNIEPNVSIKLF